MDHHRLADDIPHTETVCPYSQEGTVIIPYQRRKIPRMIGMGHFFRIVVTSRPGKVLTTTGVSLMYVQCKKTVSLEIGIPAISATIRTFPHS